MPENAACAVALRVIDRAAPALRQCGPGGGVTVSDDPAVANAVHVRGSLHADVQRGRPRWKMRWRPL